MTRVAIIGPGRVGTALALALPRDAYELVAVAGRGASSLARFRRHVPGASQLAAREAGRRAQLVLLCVPDDDLRVLVRDLARDGGVTEGSRWAHVAGGHGLEVLRPAALAGATVAACHPAQTFADPVRAAAQLDGTAWAVTVGRGAGWATGLVRDLGGVPYDVPDAARTLYHAGLVVGSNFTTAVVTLARDLLFGAGIEHPEAFLHPLVMTSAANASRHGSAALTGPVRRGDAGTVAAHLEELEATLPEAVATYRAVSRLALGLARRAGLDAAAAARMAAVLESG